MYVIRKLTYLLLLCLSAEVFAQESTDEMSAAELKQLGNTAERINDLSTASIYYQAYLDKKPKNIKMQFHLGEIYRELGEYKKAQDLFQQLWEGKGNKYPLSQYYYAEMLKATGNCKEAVPIFKEFRRGYMGEKDDRKYRRLAKNNIEGCESLSEKPKRLDAEFINVTILPEPINGEHLEASPIYLEDDVLLYNSLKSGGKTTFDADEILPKRNFYTAKEEGDSWVDKGLWKMAPTVKGKEVANGAFNFDKSRFYFSACEVNSLGKVDCDIYKIERSGKSWSSPINLGDAINSKYTETQVAVGLDEKGRETIYFVSDRKGGKGGLDIWYSIYYEKKDEYRNAKNCGSKVNSVGDEMTPFINPEDGSLYFSSDGHPGFGQLDVFYTTGQRSKWGEVTNLGSDINSAADELYYMRHESKDKGYFVSNRKRKDKNKLCCDDLYFFEELDKVKLYATGKVNAVDKKGSKSTLEKAAILLYRISDEGEKLYQKRITTDEQGKYKLRLTPDQNYLLRIEKDGYLAEEQELNTDGMYKHQDIQYNATLEAVKERVFQLADIQYEYNSSDLTKAAKEAIDTSIYEVLKTNPAMVIEISSHTDSIGSAGYNKKLSQDRAQSVVTYLRDKGIEKHRMKAKGYGESMPIAPNSKPDGSDNPEGREKNRRTEFKVVGEIEIEEELD